jgi:hypothetical protein
VGLLVRVSGCQLVLTSGEGKMKRGGNFIWHIEKNVKEINMKGIYVYQEKEEERRKENKIKGDK